MEKKREFFSREVHQKSRNSTIRLCCCCGYFGEEEGSGHCHSVPHVVVKYHYEAVCGLVQYIMGDVSQL